MKFSFISIMKVAALALPAFFWMTIYWLFGAREIVALFALLVFPAIALASITSKTGWPIYAVGYTSALIPFLLMLSYLVIDNTNLVLKNEGKSAFHFSSIFSSFDLLIPFMSLGFTAAYVFRRTT